MFLVFIFQFRTCSLWGVMSLFVVVPPSGFLLHFLCVPPSMVFVEGKVR